MMPTKTTNATIALGLWTKRLIAARSWERDSTPISQSVSAGPNGVGAPFSDAT